VASGTAADGIVRIANHGTDHADHADHAESGLPEPDDPFYSRLAYATRTGPDLDGMTDSHIALIDGSGRPSHRRPLRRVHVGGRAGISRYQAHWPAQPGGEPAVTGPWLTTASILRGCWEIRAVLVDPAPVNSQSHLRIGGWLVAADEPPAQAIDGGTASVRRTDGLTSIVSALHGSMAAAVEGPAGGNAFDNAFGAHAAVPYLRSVQPVVPGEAYAAAIALSADPAGPGEQPRLDAEVSATGAQLRVRWPDGESDHLDLGSEL
jgi:hypothetical protein